MDLDRDGRQDLVYGHRCGSGSLEAARLVDVDGHESEDYVVAQDALWSSPAQQVGPVSADNDGRADLLHLSGDRRRFHVLSKYDEGAGTFEDEDVITPVGSEVSYHVTFDNNGDGFSDILSCELVSGNWYWVGYDGSTGFRSGARLVDTFETGTFVQCEKTFVSIKPLLRGGYQAEAIAYWPPTPEGGGGWRRTWLRPWYGSFAQYSPSHAQSVTPITGPNVYLDATGDGLADGLYFYDDEYDHADIFRPRVRVADVVGELGRDGDLDLEHLDLDEDRARWLIALDYNDDGFEDLMWNPKVNVSVAGYGLQTGNWVVATYDPLGETFNDPVGTPVLAWWDKGKTTKYAQPRVDGDFNGDGRTDIAVMDTNGEYILYVRSEVTRGGPSLADDEWDLHWPDDPADYSRAHPYLLWRATNGFGATQSVRYAPRNRGNK
jgi:hypothetical protein